MTRIADEKLFAYLESALSSDERQAVESTLESSAEARDDLESCRSVIDALSAPMPIESTDLFDSIRDQVHAPPPKRRPWLFIAAAVLASAAAVLLFVRSQVPSPESEFRAKSAAGSESDADRWVGLSVFRARGDGAASPATGAISRQDGLLFAYTNLGEKPRNFLAVFAIDSTGDVHWYYPDESAFPVASIPIEAGGHVELPELITNALAPGPLTIYGVFSRRPLGLDAIREAIAEVEPGERLRISDTAQQVLRVEVLP